jgi:hypothetical protein
MATPENQLETWSPQGAAISVLDMYERICIAPKMKSPSTSMDEQDSESVIFSLREGFATSIIHGNNTPHASPRCAPWGVTFWAAR